MIQVKNGKKRIKASQKWNSCFYKNLNFQSTIIVVRQKQFAQEICQMPQTKIGFNQSTFLKLYNGTYIPRCNYTMSLDLADNLGNQNKNFENTLYRD